MIFVQVVAKKQPRCGNRTILGNWPSLIMQAYITLCFGISPSRARHQKSIISTHFECQQTLHILCYTSIFKLCMILTISKTKPLLIKTFKRNVKKIHSQFTCCITYTLCYTCSCLLPEIRRLCAYSMRLWVGATALRGLKVYI